MESYALNGYGLRVGDFQNTGKFHIFSDVDTARFLVRAMNRQNKYLTARNPPRVEVIFNKHDLAHDGYRENSFVAELKQGKRIVEVLGAISVAQFALDLPESLETSVVPDETLHTAHVLLGQMDAAAEQIIPHLGFLTEAQRNEYMFNEYPREFWLDEFIYNRLCAQGTPVSEPEEYGRYSA